MKFGSPWYGARFGAWWVLLWMVAEGVFRTFSGESAGLIGLSPLVGVPAMLAVGAVLEFLWTLWRKPVALVQAWVAEDVFARRPVAVSAGLAAMSLALVWAVCTYFLTVFINVRVKQPHFETLLSVGLSLALFIAISAFLPALMHVLRTVHRWVFRGKTRWLPVAFKVAVVLAALAGLSAVGWFGYGKRDVLLRLPWVFAGPPLAALFLALLTRRLVKTSAVSWMTQGLILGHLVYALLPNSVVSLRNKVSSGQGLAALIQNVLIKATDFDRDGSSGLYMGIDCGPFNADVGPEAHDVLDNGIDENCDGLDAQAALLPRTGSRFHPIQPPQKLPNIVLVTTDALSYAHTNLGAYPENITPNLASFAAKSTNFTNAHANAPTTYMALPMLLTGRWYPELPVLPEANGGPFGLGEDLPSIVKILKEKGYESVFVPGHNYFGPNSWVGVASGFDQIDMSGPTGYAHSASRVTNTVLKHLRKPKTKPLFLWVHYFDHHEPYYFPSGGKKFPVPPGPRGELISNYNSEIFSTDKEWGRLFRYIENQPEDEYLVVFTSDHGEAFDDIHAKKPHSHCIRNTETHVPLIIRTPHQRGTTIDGLASHLDVAPTLLNYLGIEPPPEMPGESLIPSLLQGKDPEKQAIFLSYYLPSRRDPADAFMQYGARGENFLYFHDRDASVTSVFANDDVLNNQPLAFEPEGEPLMLKLYAEEIFHAQQVKPRALFNRK